SVAVWINAYSPTDHDIWAQRIDSDGQPTGAPIQVDFTTADSNLPRVAMDGQGRFVVTWEDYNRDGTSSVMMRYFDASGAPITGITQVTAAGSTDYLPDLAASDGSFVITWVHRFTENDDDIYAERFVTSTGVPQAQGLIFVNTDTNYESAPSVAMSPDGRFDIAYERQFSGGDFDILANQYTSSGTPLGGNLYINFGTYGEFNPSISMDDAPNPVGVYHTFAGGTYCIDATRLRSDGLVGSAFSTQIEYGTDRINPRVALAPTGGRFVVTYEVSGRVGVTEIGSDNRWLGDLPQVFTAVNPAI